MLADLSSEDLNRTVTFFDTMPLATFLAKVVIWHAVHHAGEVCALKGTLVLQGPPVLALEAQGFVRGRRLSLLFQRDERYLKSLKPLARDDRITVPARARAVQSRGYAL